ncbi:MULTISPECIES: acetyl/propionyl/methylcrotonyl-CoA carboxylase subunit alpha [unclassified Marinobacterium]|jgi:3-methylcrotonyl-CoA carboxylase alpha subunit|uniref:acetyl-CoA carboxylase biotin carboxylase subunit n=1 Tax=unclassified Marinobacterium TaxID=2644139 RepID=UPI001568DDA5|nr:MULTISPECIES: acetyl/propionyl/methylcrotonyl-CoA carboxylase subunit alpha [unclassified Marinobacterium]NRP10649.1 Acetyl-/propionyl-coenzyme A carboxylase alpha chain [Marinobacterium sp. xm-g-48]NRP46769.1 Acetyl-/propionyl-coenzyme A carboxylase alpha chain [Marinobacterium sp. xm-d-543]NRP83647.1 Acetyl-/propionyl-coenzyme A carboxylase alpha chain [Marinobacterium sp. xm-d-509]NRQ01985.1 Acetyl-/propionyl-coenzyme A carboxylase alpha chain [Marinobacterium sp. xm-d-530]NRQ23326.1 Ace
MFSKILIANRGEIACRVIQTAHRLGIKCVAVYSEADANARHVTMADEAFLLGPAPSSESYLRTDAIIDICKRSGAQAVHPGYGFLSENTSFAEALEAQGITFIGPPSSAIAAMGSKSAAKAIMEDAGVPLVPGYHGEDQSPELLRKESERCGYPQLLKAIAGGGGKGMRVVNSLEEFDSALQSARREAQNAFGNPDMLIERYLTQPRHVEIQVFCDQLGHSIYLAERDCSVQRRHQKVIEEAPAPGLSDETRRAMGEAAVRAAEAINYVGAGTVEFLYDVDGSFYFMEMNTRLQVEHPVTEMITGLDLVEWQLRIASGEALPLAQNELTIKGHALEARIYAEDPENDFLPATGKLNYLRTPVESNHVRVDTGVVEGDEVSIYYDPMIAKLIVWDECREKAVDRMVQALEDYRISGVKTNTQFLHALADSTPFRECELDTGFIEKHEKLIFKSQSADKNRLLAIATAFFCESERSNSIIPGDQFSPFSSTSSWRLNSSYSRPVTLVIDDEHYDLNVLEIGNCYHLSLGDIHYEVKACLSEDLLSLVIDGHKLSVHGNLDGDKLALFYQGEQFECIRHRQTFTDTNENNEGSLSAPMNGAVVAVLVEEGQEVTAGQALVIMEAMKMEHKISAPYDGKVSSIFYADGDMVSEGADLIAIEPLAEVEA